MEGSTSDVEGAISRQLDQSPWQVTGGRSNEELIVVLFQNTTSADIQGLAWVQAIDGSAALEAAADAVGRRGRRR